MKNQGLSTPSFIRLRFHQFLVYLHVRFGPQILDEIIKRALEFRRRALPLVKAAGN